MPPATANANPALTPRRRVVHGSLLASDFLQDELPALRTRAAAPAARIARRRFRTWWVRASATLGPASGLHAVVDVGAVRLVEALGYRVTGLQRDAAVSRAIGVAGARGGARVGLLVGPWGADLARSWREAIRLGLSTGDRWCLCFNGLLLRLVDTSRSWARQHVDVDLEACALDDDGFAVLWGVAGPPALAPLRPGAETALDDLVARSSHHAVRVCGSLQQGVRSALDLVATGMLRARRATRRAADGDSVQEQALIVVFRLLFLLYAEARGLVPMWHPVYRESYSIESLREAIDESPMARGLWEAVQAISRLAHAGCRLDTLVVTAFNGHLFAPEGAPLAEHVRLGDAAVRQVLLDLTTRSAGRGSGRRRIAYGDLGVEQLGAVYERLLDELPSEDRPVPLAAGHSDGPSDPATVQWSRRAPRAPRVAGPAGLSARKATGTFYTPRSLTDYLVRRTLRPLVGDADPEAVLGLRVLDPAMGSGAFLVAACGYLASAYEAALVRAGRARPGDVGPADRTSFRRLVAQRCLFGVDLNPMAVHLARLSLWLTTLAADAPLTFLDHHLRVGDSLVGASPADLARQPPGPSRGGRGSVPLPLFAPDDLLDTWRHAVPVRQALSDRPDDTAAAVRAKARLLDDLAREGCPLTTWKHLADLWCAPWFWGRDVTPLGPAAFAALTDALRQRACSLPPRERDAWLAAARATAAEHRFFHWALEFPEAFVDVEGQPRPDAGFDAVLGNPPWDMVRGDAGAGGSGARLKRAAAQLAGFVRSAGLYSGATDAHVNRYQLFVERALSLLRAGGRLGYVVPWSLLADHGSTALRRRLLERCECDAIVSFDNRRAVFPIHRSVRFVLLTATAARPTVSIRCRLGEEDPAVLDRLPDEGGDQSAYPVRMSIGWLARTSREWLALPNVRTAGDVAIIDRLFAAGPAFGAPEGWGAAFGRELNATEDRDAFLEAGPIPTGAARALRPSPAHLPVVEGKHLSPFAVDLGRCDRLVTESAAQARIHPPGAWRRRRLAYRDVASAGNRLTLIAARLPPRTASTHTLFCLKTPLDDDVQAFLCGVMNSFVLNYLVRLWVATHVTTSLVARLPVPRLGHDDPRFLEVVSVTNRIETHGGGGAADHARLQGAVARLYGLTPDEFGAILETFPLVAAAERRAALDAMRRGSAGAW